MAELTEGDIPRNVSPYESMSNHERSKQRARFAGYQDKQQGEPCNPQRFGAKAGSAFDTWYRDGYDYH